MRADNTASGLSILAACTADVKLWLMQNGFQQNPDKSEAPIMGSGNSQPATGSRKLTLKDVYVSIYVKQES